MSKIPVLAKSNNNRRDSLARPDSLKLRNESRRPLSRIKNNQYSTQNTPKFKNVKSEIFKAPPLMSSLNSRKIPFDVQGKLKLSGISTLTTDIYYYLKQIVQPFFVPEFQSLVFPKALSTLHQINNSNSNIKKNAKKNPRSSIAVASEISEVDNKPKDLNLAPVFEQFKTLLRNQKNQLISLTDFILLYCGDIIVTCENDTDNVLASLFFLKQFLQLELPPRKTEAEFLSSALLRQADALPIVRGHSIQVLSLLVNYDNSIINRIKSGCECHDKSLSQFCQEVMSFMRKSVPSDQQPTPPTFASISQNANENVSNEMMQSFMSAFENGDRPNDPVLFINNIVQTMQRFARSAPILEKGSNLIGFALNLLQPSPPIEIVSEVINLCFSILSGEEFLSGNDSFDALEAIQSLSNSIFEIVPCDILLPAITATVANSTDSLLRLLMKKLSECYQNIKNDISPRQLNELASALDAFHPDFKERPPFLNISFGLDDKLASMTLSIERLLNPETIFLEMEDLIQKDPVILNDYPLYLRGFLQRAYFLYHNEEPAGMSDEQRQLAEVMAQDMKIIKDEDFANGGKYSVEVLSAQLEEMKSFNNSSW